MKIRVLASLMATAFLAFAAISSSTDSAEAAWRGGPGAGPAAADVYGSASARRFYYDRGYRADYFGAPRYYVDGLGYYGYRPYYRRHPYYRHLEHRSWGRW
jgi:hypothetical protein